jgi:hypothetical protein
MDKSIEDHMKKVRKWLDDNVQVFDEPWTVKLCDFQVDWSDFSGCFSLSLDNVTLKEKVRFGLETSGKTTFYLPMFHSPLGAPASYAAIKLTKRTNRAITAALHKTIPRLMGAGVNRETGEEITYHSPPNKRISHDLLEQAKNNVSNSYEIEARVDSV